MAIRLLDDALITGTYDVVIVGSGPAGITLGVDLAKEGRRIAIIEAGDIDFDPAIQSEYQATLSQDGFSTLPLDASRLRMLGGTSNHWAGWCAPLMKSEFSFPLGDHNQGWPLDFAEIDAWYSRACDTLDIGPPLFSLEDYPEASDPTFRGLENKSQLIRTFRFSSPTRFAEKFLPNLEAEDIDVFIRAPATGLTTSGTKVSGCIARPRDGTNEVLIPCENLVIAAGGIESTVLLQRFDRDLQFLPEGSSDLLGRGFMEHPHFGGVRGFMPLEPSSLEYFGTRTDSLGISYRHALILDEPHMPSISMTIDRLDTPSAGNPRGPIDAVLAKLFPQSQGQEYVGYFRTEMPSLRENNITLEDESYQVTLRAERTRQMLDDSIGLFFDRIAASGLAYIQPDFAWLTRDFAGGNHHLGGTVMGSSELDGVVSRNLDVFGMEGLFVLSSSIFPRGGFANPTLSVVAFAHRLAAHLNDVSGP